MNQLLRDYLTSPVDDRKVMDDTFKMLTGYVLFSKKLGTLADIPEIEMEFLDLVKETASELVAEFEKDSEIEL
mgnify:CR=1 FL=1